MIYLPWAVVITSELLPVLVASCRGSPRRILEPRDEQFVRHAEWIRIEVVYPALRATVGGDQMAPQDLIEAEGGAFRGCLGVQPESVLKSALVAL